MVINMHDTASQYATYQAWIVYFIVVVLLMVCNLRAKSLPLNKISVSFLSLNLSSYFQDMIMFLNVNLCAQYLCYIHFIKSSRAQVYMETNFLIVRLLSFV